MENMKTYLLDTNVLIQDPDSIFKFEDNEVVISTEKETWRSRI